MDLVRWLNHHAAIKKRLSIGQKGLLVTSDIIETFFYVYKKIVVRTVKTESLWYDDDTKFIDALVIIKPKDMEKFGRGRKSVSA